jgi:hypothetical protein
MGQSFLHDKPREPPKYITRKVKIKFCSKTIDNYPTSLTTTNGTRYEFLSGAGMNLNPLMLKQLNNFLISGSVVRIVHDRQNFIHKVNNIYCPSLDDFLTERVLNIVSLSKGLVLKTKIHVTNTSTVNQFFLNKQVVSISIDKEINVIIEDDLRFTIPNVI